MGPTALAAWHIWDGSMISCFTSGHGRVAHAKSKCSQTANGRSGKRPIDASPLCRTSRPAFIYSRLPFAGPPVPATQFGLCTSPVYAPILDSSTPSVCLLASALWAGRVAGHPWTVVFPVFSEPQLRDLKLIDNGQSERCDDILSDITKWRDVLYVSHGKGTPPVLTTSPLAKSPLQQQQQQLLPHHMGHQLTIAEPIGQFSWRGSQPSTVYDPVNLHRHPPPWR